MKKFNKKGFTIVELVIVIAVIGILAGVLIPTFSSITQRANETAAMQEATAGRDAILVLTEGQMPEKSMFYINEHDKTGFYTTNYVFAYEKGTMESKNIKEADKVKAPEYKKVTDKVTYIAYVSTEVLTIDKDGDVTGFSEDTEYANYPKYLASLAGYTGEGVTAGTAIDGYIAITWSVTTGESKTNYTIQVYWSADLHDTLVIFLAGAQVNQQN